MAATAQSEVSVVELKAEIERLSRELDQASSEKIQSAQLGLVLLEEKSALQQRCDELESLFENTRHELEITQEVSVLHSAVYFHFSCINGYMKREQTETFKLIMPLPIRFLHYFQKVIRKTFYKDVDEYYNLHKVFSDV